MGGNMARRLKDCGYTISAVHDAHAPAAAALATELGATHATRLADVTAAADVIFTVVTDDAAQLAVFAESGDSLLSGARGKVFVNCATLTPAVHVEVQRRVQAAGAASLEGCMASSPAGPLPATIENKTVTRASAARNGSTRFRR